MKFNEGTTYIEAFNAIYNKLEELDKKINEVSVKADQANILIRPAIDKLDNL